MNLKNAGDRIQRLAASISIVVFAVSLSQYSYCTLADKNGECTSAMSLLLAGGLGIFMGEPASILWLANLTLLATWIMTFTAPRFTLIISAATLLIMLFFLAFDKVLINESGSKSLIVSYENGYWLWVMSAAIMVAGTLVSRLLSRSQQVAHASFADSLFQQ